MTCFHPLTAYRALTPNPDTGKRGIVFNPSKSLMSVTAPIRLPCGQCSGCRADRSHEWALRCTHEAKAHLHNNCFLTLTYEDDQIPQSYSISVREMQLFMKRLRKRFGSGIRFFLSGEYSDFPKLRPHYHLLLFNFDFPDKVKVRVRDGFPVYTSEAAAELWTFGSHEIGSLTVASAGYVARYCIKKMTGDKADEHYRRVSPVNGETYMVEPEFATMSRGGRDGDGGIGMYWFRQFRGDAFPSDFLISDGRKVRPPSSYLKKLEAEESASATPAPAGRVLRHASSTASAIIKRKRRARSSTPEAKANATPARLAVREFIHKDRIKRLKRQL
jgi:hypothetical protein